MTSTEAVKTIRGKKGTKVVLTVSREGEDEPLEIEIIRDEIKLLPVESKMLEPGPGLRPHQGLQQGHRPAAPRSTSTPWRRQPAAS